MEKKQDKIMQLIKELQDEVQAVDGGIIIIGTVPETEETHQLIGGVSGKGAKIISAICETMLHKEADTLKDLLVKGFKLSAAKKILNDL